MNDLPHLLRGIIIALLLLAPAWLLAAEPAGYVLMATGEVVAVQPDSQVRALTRRSPFYPGESLKTGADAKAQVRFRDGALISLRPDTEIRIDDFRYQESDGGEDKNIFTLINGGFRTITGKIGKKNPKNYQMKSSVASIGVRGTNYEVVLDKGLNVATWQGTIVVENAAGAITLGAQGVFNFAHVAGRTAKPLGLMTPPPVIGENPELSSAQVPDEGDTDLENEESEQLANAPAPDDGEPVPDRLSNSDPDEPAPTPVILGQGSFIPEPVIDTGDQRLQGVSLSRVGIVQKVDAVSGFDYLVAPSGEDANGTPLFADVGLSPDDPNFYSAVASEVLRQGSAPLVASYDAPALGVSWGIWDGNALPAELATDPGDASIVTPISQPVHWLAVAASDATTVSAKTGQFRFRNVLAFDGVGSDGSVTGVYVDLGVDFDSASVAGDMHVHTANELWDVDLSGTVSAQGLSITSVSGSVNGTQSVTGVAELMFVGSAAEALAGMASFEVVGNAAAYLDSMFLVKNDVRLGGLVLERAGIVLESNALPGVHYSGGLAAAGTPVFADNGLLPGDALFDVAAITDVISQGGATLISSYDDPNYAISWGIWSGATLQTDPNDATVTSNLSDPVVWMSVLPSDDVVLASRSGGAYYHSAPVSPATQGISNGGLGITSLNADLKVDFDMAQFKGALSLMTNPSDSWDLSFDGNLVGARLEVTAMSGTYSGAGGSGAASGNLFMVLSGSTDPNAIAGAFDLEYAADPNYYVQGNFIAARDLRLGFNEAPLDRVVLGALGSSGSNATLIGRASGGTSPVIGLSNYYFDPAQPAFWLEEANDIIKQGGTPDLVAAQTTTSYQVGSPDPAYEVSWGAWNGQATALNKQTDPLDPTMSTAVNSDLFWITFMPTAIDGGTGTPGGKTGQVVYDQTATNWVAGSTSTGAINNSSFYFSANVDFDTGNVTSGTMGFSDASNTNYWNASFTGTLNGAELQISSPLVYYNSDTVNPAAAEMKGMLTGPQAEGIAGSFDFDYMAGTATAEGVFLSNCAGNTGC